MGRALAPAPPPPSLGRPTWASVFNTTLVTEEHRAGPPALQAEIWRQGPGAVQVQPAGSSAGGPTLVSVVTTEQVETEQSIGH